MYYFLKEDFEALNAEIGKITDKIREIGQDMGRSCQEGAETFHDNFAYEDGERQQYMWSTRIRELIHIKNRACVVESQEGETISLGHIVTVENQQSGKVQAIKIGSYMVLAEPEGKTISYNAPLARMLIGGKVGETKEAIIADKKMSLLILRIDIKR